MTKWSHSILKFRKEAILVQIAPSTIFKFFCCYAATQLALQVHQERSRVVCGNKEARKRLTDSKGTRQSCEGTLVEKVQYPMPTIMW